MSRETFFSPTYPPGPSASSLIIGVGAPVFTLPSLTFSTFMVEAMQSSNREITCALCALYARRYA
jgi:hypothetical protein